MVPFPFQMIHILSASSSSSHMNIQRKSLEVYSLACSDWRCAGIWLLHLGLYLLKHMKHKHNEKSPHGHEDQLHCWFDLDNKHTT